MTFMHFLLAGLGLVALVVGCLAAAIALPCSGARSPLARFGIVVVCLGGSLFAVATAAIVLFMIALGLSDM